MGNKVSLENELINLRLTSKQQQRGALKCNKNEAAAKAKLREAIKAGNIEGARIYGQNAIREKNQALNCLRLSSRIDAVASRLETAIRMKQVSPFFLYMHSFMGEAGAESSSPDVIFRSYQDAETILLQNLVRRP